MQSDALAAARELEGLGVRAVVSAPRIVAHYTALLATRAQANASGRPGPNAVTGDYRRAIGWQSGADTALGTVWGVVGTDKPQGRRLEMGFHGVDSLGRRYDQPPYPHFGPAFDAVAPLFEVALGELVAVA
jgi:hypothetical protein